MPQEPLADTEKNTGPVQDQAKKQVEDSSDNTSTPGKYLGGKPSRTYELIEKILVWNKQEKGWAVAPEISKVAPYLTLRQVKSWFRHVLMGSSQEGFLTELREQNFPWLNELERKNKLGFEQLRLISHHMTKLVQVNLFGVADRYFVDQLDGILKANGMPYSAYDVWPRKPKEQHFLLFLLTTPDPLAKPHGDSPTDSIQDILLAGPYPDSPVNKVQNEARTNEWEGAFDAFCKKHFGRKFTGDPDEKISQLDDSIREDSENKLRARDILEEYGQHIFPNHLRVMSKTNKVAISLANLGILLDGLRGEEPLAAAFFEAALHRGGTVVVCNSYAEFLLGCLADDNKLQDLAKHPSFAGNTRKIAEERIKALSGDASQSDPLQEFRRQINLLRVRIPPDKGAEHIPAIRETVQRLAPYIMQDLYEESSSKQIILRLDASLDQMLRDPTLLNERTAILLPFWRVAEFDEGCPKYRQDLKQKDGFLQIVKLIANNAVGQSAIRALGEIAGVRLSRHLLGFKAFILSNQSYSSQIFTQVMVALARYDLANRVERLALCALAALSLIVESQEGAVISKWVERVTRVWEKFGLGPCPNNADKMAESLIAKFHDESSLVKDFLSWLHSQEELNEPKLFLAIFGSDFEPITTCESFTDAMNWPRELWKKMDSDARLICGLPPLEPGQTGEQNSPPGEPT
ncbi:MAG: hypothetical protein HQL90_07610 [Magnetococcales bacterium]|nr:hypothetical protein [Magnetococcales bacterium]